MSEVSAVSVKKMERCENVINDVLPRICETFDCNIEDITEHVQITEAIEKEELS